jgi:hypothetical protein
MNTAAASEARPQLLAAGMGVESAKMKKADQGRSLTGTKLGLKEGNDISAHA